MRAFSVEVERGMRLYGLLGVPTSVRRACLAVGLGVAVSCACARPNTNGERAALVSAAGWLSNWKSNAEREWRRLGANVRLTGSGKAPLLGARSSGCELERATVSCGNGANGDASSCERMPSSGVVERECVRATRSTYHPPATGSSGGIKPDRKDSAGNCRRDEWRCPVR